jgi:hypothetical protein
MSLATCAVCNEAMLVVEPDQITHPCCDPDDTPLPVLSIEEIAETLGGRIVDLALPPDASDYPVLFSGSDICRDCGEPYGQDGFSTRCLRRHWRWQDRPCERCAGAIDYRSPRKLDDGTVNPKSLTVASIVTPAQGKRRGWDKELINALSNKQPVHAVCAEQKATDQTTKG